MIKTLELKGTHATNRTRAASIQKNGFKPSEKGRAGYGFYAWESANETSGRHMARLWWNFLKKKKCLEGEDYDGVILFIALQCDEGEYLDTTTAEFQGALMEYALKYSDKGNAYDADEHDRTFNFLIYRFQEEYKKNYKALRAIVIPPRVSFPQVFAFPAFYCHVIRRNFEEIAIEKIEECEN